MLDSPDRPDSQGSSITVLPSREASLPGDILMSIALIFLATTAKTSPFFGLLNDPQPTSGACIFLVSRALPVYRPGQHRRGVRDQLVLMASLKLMFNDSDTGSAVTRRWRLPGPQHVIGRSTNCSIVVNNVFRH